MRFRLKVLLTIAAAVVAISLIEATFDFAAPRTRAWLEAETERQLERYADSLAAAIEMRGVVPVRVGSATIDTPRRRRVLYRIVLDDQVVHGARDGFPRGESAWDSTERALVGGFRLEAAIRRTPIERFVMNDLLVDVMDLPLFLVLAFVLSGLLTRNIIRPVRELTLASEQLARQQLPEPIAVPSGDDELSRMARSFNTMSDSIQGLLERERVFTRYASHELRTPLGALRAQVERAQLGLVPADEILPALQRNIHRMEGIIGALLQLARSSERDAEPMPLLPLVRELVRTFPPDEIDRITIAEGSDPSALVTDARLVQQALQNLLENALRHAPGPVALRIDARDEWITLGVRDSGPGLPRDLLEGPRKPFDRRGGGRAGLGLGLSLVANITQALNGELELRNRPLGLEATLTLPVRVEGRGRA